jgi:hypothetical protein
MNLVFMDISGRLYRLQTDGLFSELLCRLTDTAPMDMTNSRGLITVPDAAVDCYFCDPVTLRPITP